MTFLAPWAAWFLAGIPIIVALYLLKVKRRPLSVSTLMFWQRVLQENRRRALFQRLRNLLSLLLHLLIFALILAALAKPTFDAFSSEGSSTVLVLDTRARMQALEDGGTRFEKARALAAPYLKEAGAGKKVALILAGHSPGVAVPFTGDERRLREALAAAAPTDTGGDMQAAVALARTLLSARKGEHRIVVLTDRALPSEALKIAAASSTEPAATSASTPAPETAASASAPPSPSEPASVPPVPLEPVTWVGTGGPHDNVAITRFSTRPLLNSPQTSEVLLEIRNFGTAPAKGNLELALDGQPLEVRPYEIAPGGKLLDFFPIVPRPGRSSRGWLSARIDVPDALPLDNVAYAVLPIAAPPRVLLVTKGNWFLEKLLGADLQIRFELLGPDSFTPAMAGKFDVVLLDNCLPPGFVLGEDTANYFFFKQTPFTQAGPLLEQPILTEIDSQNPALRLVSWQDVTIVRAAPMRVPAADAFAGWSFESPLRAFEEPLLITGTRRAEAGLGPRRLAALGFDVAESDLPLRIAFPLLMTNTIQWLAGDAVPVARGAQAGQSVELGEGQTLWAQAQTDFAAPAQPPADAALVGAFFQPLKQGFYLLNSPAPALPAWMAVNTFSDAESDLRAGFEAAASSEAPAPMARLAWKEKFIGKPLWQYLIMAALALFTLEWALFHRRRTE